MGIRRKSRELIVQTLYALAYAETDEYLLSLDYINIYKGILNDLAAENGIDIDNGIYKYAEKILKGLLPKIDDLDKMINKYIVDYELEKIGLLDLIIMRLAVYEMLYARIPAPVMIDEAVEISKRFCAEKSPQMINAILDLFNEKELKI